MKKTSSILLVLLMSIISIVGCSSKYDEETIKYVEDSADLYYHSVYLPGTMVNAIETGDTDMQRLIEEEIVAMQKQRDSLVAPEELSEYDAFIKEYSTKAMMVTMLPIFGNDEQSIISNSEELMNLNNPSLVADTCDKYGVDAKELLEHYENRD